MAAFIVAQRDRHGIGCASACRALGVSPAWFYKWRHGDPSGQHARREQLKIEIRRLFAAHRGTYGSPRIAADLREQGWRVSDNTVAALMRQLDLAARRRRRRREDVAVHNRCLTEAGWTLEVSTDGSVGFAYPTAQAEAFNLASYVCHAQYPVNDRFLQPLSHEQLQVQYDHLRDSYIPCLRSHGFAPDDLPSFETFAAADGHMDPLPFDQALAAMKDGRVASLEELEELCPKSPGWDELYGE